MDTELNTLLPRWEVFPNPAAGGPGEVFTLQRADDFGITRADVLRVISIQAQPGETSEALRERVAAAAEALSMVSLLTGCGNILIHTDHWIRQNGANWDICVRTPALPTLAEHCRERLAGQAELIRLSSDPVRAAAQLRQYREKQRLPDEMILQLGISLCLALEQCQEKGLGQCAVTPDTVYISPAGEFLLGGLGIPHPAAPTGVKGLGQVLYSLLGGTGETIEPPLGPPELRMLIKRIREEDMDTMDLCRALEEIANGETTLVYQKTEKETEAVPSEETIIAHHAANEGTPDNGEAGPQKDAAEEIRQKEPEEKSGKDVSQEESGGYSWNLGGDLTVRGSYKGKTEKKDYSAIIRRKAALTAMIGAGTGHTVCLLRDGTAAATGKNGNFQCNVSSWRGLQAVAAGDGHTVGLTTDGTVRATGNNGFGQCNVTDWTGIIQISAGSFHTVGLRNDGTVVAVGKSADNRCNVGFWSGVAAVAAGVDHTVGLKPDGTVMAVGSNKYGQCNVGGWKDIVAISAGAGYTLGLRADGSVASCGWNDQGKCNVAEWKNITLISAGVLHSTGLRRDGTVIATGNNGGGKCDVSGWTDVAAIASGADHTLALREDGSMLAVGNNTFGQCAVSGLRNVCVPGLWVPAGSGAPKDPKSQFLARMIRKKADMGATISAGGDHVVCLLNDGTVTRTGNRNNVKAWRMVKAVSAGVGHTVALRLNGRLLAEGNNAFGQCNVADWEDIVQVAAGYYHTVGLRADGTVAATGKDDDRQCQVRNWKDIAAISAGQRHTVGLRSDGTVVAVGDNTFGQLDVDKWKNVVAISAGSEHTVALLSNGRVVATGCNGDNQCSVFGWTNITAISAGATHTVGLRGDGTVIAVGRDVFSQCNVENWKNIVAISAGKLFTVGLRADGTAVAIGLNIQGRVTGWKNICIPK